MYNLNFFLENLHHETNMFMLAIQKHFSYEVLAALANIWLVCFLRYKAL